MFISVVLFISALRCSEAFSNGNIEVACDSMTPQHGVGPQSSPAPYILTGAQNPDGSINVKLDSTAAGDGIFEGFFLQARNSAGARVGAFTNQPATAKLLSCDFPGGGVAHNSNTKQSSIDVLWQPQSYTGDVQFRATVVRSFSTFWTGVTSENYVVQQQPNNVPQPPTGMQTPDFNPPSTGSFPLIPPSSYLPPVPSQPNVQPQPQPQPPGGGYQPPIQPQPQPPGGGYQPPIQPQPQPPGGGYQPPTQPQPQPPGGGYQPPTVPQPPFIFPPNPSPGIPQPNPGYLPPIG